MLKIKLARFGKRNQPHYRIVINEAKSKRDGQYIENIGRYVPQEQPKVLELDIERYDHWISQGAQPTETVASLAERFKSGDPFPAKKKKLSKKARAKAAKAEEEAKAEKEAKKEEAKAEKEAKKEEEKPAKEEKEEKAKEE